jgi:hypothetical protein
MRPLLPLLLLTGCGVWPRPAEVETRPPEVAEGALLRPTFDTSAGRGTAGNAFAGRLEGVERPVIVTCLHLFGRRGGLERDLKAEELPREVRRVTLADRFSEAAVGEATAVLPLPDAGDVAVLWAAKGTKAVPWRFAKEAPAKEAMVWLIARVPGTARRAHKGRVITTSDGILEYRFEQKLELREANGGPVLNAAGEVIGVQIGSDDIDAFRHGFALPVDRFLPRLTQAAAAVPPG